MRGEEKIDLGDEGNEVRAAYLSILERTVKASDTNSGSPLSMMNESVCPEVLIPVMACLEGTTYDRARDVFISVCEFMEKHGGRYARKHLCYRRALQDYESSPRWPPSFNLRSTFPDEPNP